MEELDLSHNALETLPESLFGSLKAMTLLDLDGNRLDTLPAGIFAGLTALRTLWVADNELSNLLDTVFSGLSALTWIDLDGNEFTTVPDDLFGGLSNLSKLWLRNNQLNALSADAFSGLTALNELKLDGNPTDPLPVTVGLEATSSGQFKGSVPAGAPFELILPVQVSGGTLSGVATTITIPQGSTGSSSQGASRTPGSKAPVTVDIESLPRTAERRFRIRTRQVIRPARRGHRCNPWGPHLPHHTHRAGGRRQPIHRGTELPTHRGCDRLGNRPTGHGHRGGSHDADVYPGHLGNPAIGGGHGDGRYGHHR